MQFESLFVYFSDILTFVQYLQVFLQFWELAVWSSIVGEDGDGILKLEYVGIGGIVQKDHLFRFAIYHSEIFGIDSLSDFMAMSSVQAVAEYLVVRVDFVEDWVDVWFMACSEDNDLKHFAHFLQKSQSVGSQINTSSCLTVRKLDFDVKVIAIV